MSELFNRTELKSRRQRLRGEMTRAEKVIWINIRNEKILGVKFRRQFSVGKFILDFYSPSLRLAIEVDGASHDVDGAQRYDESRQKWIEETAGIAFLRYTDSEVLNAGEEVVKKITEQVRVMLSQTRNL